MEKSKEQITNEALQGKEREILQSISDVKEGVKQANEYFDKFGLEDIKKITDIFFDNWSKLQQTTSLVSGILNEEDFDCLSFCLHRTYYCLSVACDMMDICSNLATKKDIEYRGSCLSLGFMDLDSILDHIIYPSNLETWYTWKDCTLNQKLMIIFDCLSYTLADFSVFIFSNYKTGKDAFSTPNGDFLALSDLLLLGLHSAFLRLHFSWLYNFKSDAPTNEPINEALTYCDLFDLYNAYVIKPRYMEDSKNTIIFRRNYAFSKISQSIKQFEYATAKIKYSLYEDSYSSHAHARPELTPDTIAQALSNLVQVNNNQPKKKGRPKADIDAILNYVHDEKNHAGLGKEKNKWAFLAKEFKYPGGNESLAAIFREKYKTEYKLIRGLIS